MKRSIPLVGLLLIIAAGSWAFYTQPAVTKPAPARPITQAPHTPALLSQMEAADAADAKKANTIPPKVLAAKIKAQLKKQGGNDMSVKIKPGQSGVVRAPWYTYGDFSPNIYSTDTGGATSNGSTNSDGYTFSWTAISEQFSDTTFRNTSTPGHPTNYVDVLVSVPIGATAGDVNFVLNSLDDNSNSYCDGYGTTFTVTGDLTGSVNVGQQTYATASNTVTASLKADTATGLEVVSGSLDWDDGSSADSQSPGTQHYSGTATHTYTVEGDYTISWVVTDNASPTPNTITVTTTVHVCFPTSTEVTDFIAKWGGATVSPLLKLIQTSSTFDSGTGLYTNCYKVGIWVNGQFATEANRDVWFPDASWILPDIATTSDDLTDNVGTINFCISSTTNNESQSLSQITCSTYIDVGMCGMAIGLPLDRFTVGSITTFRRGSGGGFWGMLHR